MESILDHALNYAQMNWPIFPVKFKVPLTEHGFYDASTDEDTIRKWYAEFPDAGIALSTGKPSGVVVLDFDIQKHSEAKTFLDRLLKDKNFKASTVRSRSGGGGLHMFYKLPEDKDISSFAAWSGIPGFDIRGTGGYLLLPPSPHESGNYYEWITTPDQEMPDLPEMFYKERKVRRKVINVDVKEGKRHLEMARRAGMLRAAGLEPEQILQNLVLINQRYCKPPLEEKELEIIAESMIRYPAYNTKDNGVDKIKCDEEKRSPHEENQKLITFELNDTGHAEALAYLHGKKLRYNCHHGQWLIWGGQFWEPDETGYITWFIVDTYRRIKAACELIEDEDRREKTLKSASGLGNYKNIKSALAVAQSLNGFATLVNDWNADPMLFGVKNGILDLRTGEVSDGKPSQLISKCSETHFDKKAACPRWEQFLQEIFSNNQPVINFIQRAIGYTLTGLVSEQYVYMLIGNGSNGKSTFLNIILKILGSYGIKTPFGTFERRFSSSTTNDIASLEGHRFIMASESNKGVVIDEARLKSLTGGDPISARYLYKEHFTFKPSGKIFLGINHRPIVKDDSYGFWRRVLLIDFPVQFNEASADKELDKKLNEELPGILNWAIEGCLLWQKSGLMIPDCVKIATEQYKFDSNPLQDMVAAYCAVEQGNIELTVNSDDLYKVYIYFAGQHNLKPSDRLSRTSFLNTFDNNYVHSSFNGSKVYYGIALNDAGIKIANNSEINLATRIIVRKN